MSKFVSLDKLGVFKNSLMTVINNSLSTKANVSDLSDVATSGDYTDLLNKPTNISDFTNDSGYLTGTSKIDLTNITDNSTDNANTNKSIKDLMYFKDNEITNISQVYKSGLYGVRNNDATTPYAGYWFVAVFCKDLERKIAVQWAMDVGIAHNGELWMRTIRLNAIDSADGNYVGPWRKLLNKTYADTLYSSVTHTHSEYPTTEEMNTAISNALLVDETTGV